MTEFLAALLLGIIEGITEFLPISSTGHLLIAERWLGHRSDLFNISIQAGAILAVVVIYRQRLWDLATGFFTEHASRDYAAKLAVAFGVTAVLGLAMKKLGFQLPETVTPVAWALVIGAAWMVAAEHFAADIVAIHGLEIGLGRGDGAVIETDRDHRGVEEYFFLLVRGDQGIGHNKNLNRHGARIQVAQGIEVMDQGFEENHPLR